jgi:hypothetical protein
MSAFRVSPLPSGGTEDVQAQLEAEDVAPRAIVLAAGAAAAALAAVKSTPTVAPESVVLCVKLTTGRSG